MDAPLLVASCGRSAYMLDRRVALYIKYSTSRLSPWSFSLSRSHQLELEELAARCEAVFLVLVCGRDGLACISRSELNRVLDDVYQETEWVRVSRRARQKYLITGTDDRRGFKVADSEFPAKVVTALSAAPSISSSPAVLSRPPARNSAS
jgi:hypothetical protein